MIKPHVSLKDIAKELGISISTVSRALKSHPDISPQLTTKVKDLAKEWGYTPNPLAMGLLKQQTKMIGVIVPDLVTHFYSSIISGIENVARQNGYHILITSSYESYEKEKECLENLLSSRAEGIIMCLSKETTDFAHFDKIIQKEIPLVFFDRICRSDEVPSIVADNSDAARSVVHHFFETGARRIAHITGPSHMNISKERMDGYLKGLEDCGLTIDNSLIVKSDLTTEATIIATRQLLSLPSPPDAIFSINDMVAFTAMREIKQSGFKIPEDIRMVGITDDFHATVVDPPLTSVMHPTEDMGMEAARLFLHQCRFKSKPEPLQIIVKTKLVVRQSSQMQN